MIAPAFFAAGWHGSASGVPHRLIAWRFDIEARDQSKLIPQRPSEMFKDINESIVHQAAGAFQKSSVQPDADGRPIARLSRDRLLVVWPQLIV
jgi:hypothetical protein